MKTAILYLYSLYIIGLATASPKHFRNLYKRHGIKTDLRPRIIGGQEAAPHSIPYQVFLEVYSPGKIWYCGGSLISQNYVLTSGYCIDGAQQVQVTLGAHNLLETEYTEVVLISTELILHDQYDPKLVNNDIGLIKLPEPVELSETIQTIDLPRLSDKDNDYAGETARMSGWGSNQYNIDGLTSVLNYVDVAVISNDVCKQLIGNAPETRLCTSGAKSTGSCFGDSGGPLVYNNTLIGTGSYVFLCTDSAFPSSFSRITKYLSWIAEHTDVQIS